MDISLKKEMLKGILKQVQDDIKERDPETSGANEILKQVERDKLAHL